MSEVQTKPPVDDPEDYAKLAREAQRRLEEAQARSARAQKDAQAALVARAALLEADMPSWEVLQRDPYGVSEILAVEGGFFVRSIWQRRIAMGEPMVSSSAVLFVAGPAPKLVPDHGSILVSFSDVPAGIDPTRARLSDLAPTRRYREATEVLLKLPDGSVRVLKAPDLPPVIEDEKE